MAKKNADEEDDTFGEALRNLRKANHYTQATMAEILGVSLKTFSRWEGGTSVPGKFQKHGIVTAIGTGWPEHRNDIARSLGFEIVARPAAPAPNMDILRAALDGALFEATEKLGAPPQKVREAVAVVLERVALIGMDAKTAASLVRGKA